MKRRTDSNLRLTDANKSADLPLPLRGGTQMVLYRGFVSEPIKKLSLYGPIAQLGEHLPCKQEVAGSNLAGSTITDTAV